MRRAAVTKKESQWRKLISDRPTRPECPLMKAFASSISAVLDQLDINACLLETKSGHKGRIVVGISSVCEFTVGLLSGITSRNSGFGNCKSSTFPASRESAEMMPLRQMILAIELMHQQGVAVNREMVYIIVQSCIKQKDTTAAKLFITVMLNCKLNLVASIGDLLIRFFASDGCLIYAKHVFNIISSPTVHTWHAIIVAHSICGEKQAAINVYYSMLERSEITPNTYIFSCILKVCSETKNLQQGVLIYCDVIKMGLETDVVVGSALIDMYSKCKRIKEATSIFDKLETRNVVSWNVMMTGLVNDGKYDVVIELFEKMINGGMNPDKVTFLCVMKAYSNRGSVMDVKMIDDLVAQSPYASDHAVRNSFVDVYAKCGDIEKANKIFESLESKDIIAWSSMISGYVRNGHGIHALESFEKMQKEGIRPDKVSFLCVLKACSTIGASRLVRQVHDQLIRNGLVFDVMIGNTLIDTYAESGSIEQAEIIFEALQDRTAVSWNTMLSAYVQHGLNHAALELFDTMRREGTKPTTTTFSCISKVCGNLGDFKSGQIMHDQFVRDHLKMDLVVGNTFIDMYAKCGCLDDARRILDDLSDSNVVSWGAIIAAYLHHEDCGGALRLYRMMQEKNVEPDSIIILSILKTCGSICALNQGKILHDHAIRSGVECDLEIGNTLIDMYAKCASIRDARKMFTQLLSNQNVVSWNVMLSGYAQHGYGRLALQCFENMRLLGIMPTNCTFTSVLAACSHAGQIHDGYRYFRSMSDSYNMAPGLEHVNCIVDLLGNVGRLYEAEEMLNSVPFLPDVNGWMSLLTSCLKFGNKKLGRRCLEEVVRLCPGTSAGHVLMQSICSDALLWDDI